MLGGRMINIQVLYSIERVEYGGQREEKTMDMRCTVYIQVALRQTGERLQADLQAQRILNDL
jgi:hypothetical protein